MVHLPRVSAFPIVGEKNVITLSSHVLVLPSKEKRSALVGQMAPDFELPDHEGRRVVSDRTWPAADGRHGEGPLRLRQTATGSVLASLEPMCKGRWPESATSRRSNVGTTCAASSARDWA
jgi:hypothetical protein